MDNKKNESLNNADQVQDSDEPGIERIVDLMADREDGFPSYWRGAYLDRVEDFDLLYEDYEAKPKSPGLSENPQARVNTVAQGKQDSTSKILSSVSGLNFVSSSTQTANNGQMVQDAKQDNNQTNSSATDLSSNAVDSTSFTVIALR